MSVAEAEFMYRALGALDAVCVMAQHGSKMTPAYQLPHPAGVKARSVAAKDSSRLNKTFQWFRSDCKWPLYISWEGDSGDT
jgi:hypothetical protein